MSTIVGISQGAVSTGPDLSANLPKGGFPPASMLGVRRQVVKSN
jgi:hypothetical protein